MIMSETERTPTIRYVPVVLTLGLITIATQIILLREFLSVFYGNELVIGIIFTNWMLLTALGAYLGRMAGKMIQHWISILGLLIILALLPLVMVFMMYYLRSAIFVAGSMVNLLHIFIYSLFLLLPFCLISGFIFTLLCDHISNAFSRNLIGKIYSWESTGSIVGGILFNLILIWFFESFESLLFLVLLVIAILFFVSIQWKFSILLYLLPALFIFILLLQVFVDFDRITRNFLFQDQQIRYFKSTPYGNIAVTKSGDQLNFYENNFLLYSSNQPVSDEETVHYTMAQHENPEKVLLLSGGMPGVIREILKYPVQQIDYVEINPWMIRAVNKYSDIYDTSGVHVINRDARLYLKKHAKKYDVALINLPEPSTVQMNRFYTQQFYGLLKENLAPHGVMGFSIPGASNYMSEEQRKLNASLYHTVKTIFRNAIIIPGKENFFIASDDQLTFNVTDKIAEKGIETQYVNRYYVQEDLLKSRAGKLLDNLSPEVEINTDFKPVTYLLNLQYWVSYFNFNYWVPLLITGLLAFLFMFRLHPVNLGMFTAGFAGASIEVVLLVAFQILYGYVYSLVGIIVTVFMGGLAFGTYYRERIVPHTTFRNYYRIQLMLGVFALLLPLLFLLLRDLQVPPVLIHAVFMILMFLTAMLVGIIFSLASQLRLKKLVKLASDVYSVDLLGAAIGSFMVTVYLIPVLGILNVCLFIGGLNLLSGLMTVLRL